MNMLQARGEDVSGFVGAEDLLTSFTVGQIEGSGCARLSPSFFQTKREVIDSFHDFLLVK